MKHLIISVSNSSDWDNCDTLLVSLTDKTVKEFLAVEESIKKLPTILPIKEDLDYFSSISFYGNYGEWGFLDEVFEYEKDKNEKLVSKKEMERLENLLQSPEQNLVDHMVKFGKRGFKFVCYGKYTGEVFFTNEIPYSLLK